MQQWYDVERDGVVVRLGRKDLALLTGVLATADEMERHAKPFRLSTADVRGFGRAPVFTDLFFEQAWWQGWAIRCERALASPEPGWDANGAPV